MNAEVTMLDHIQVGLIQDLYYQKPEDIAKNVLPETKDGIPIYYGHHKDFGPWATRVL